MKLYMHKIKRLSRLFTRGYLKNTFSNLNNNMKCFINCVTLRWIMYDTFSTYINSRDMCLLTAEIRSRSCAKSATWRAEWRPINTFQERSRELLQWLHQGNLAKVMLLSIDPGHYNHIVYTNKVDSISFRKKMGIYWITRIVIITLNSTNDSRIYII